MSRVKLEPLSDLDIEVFFFKSKDPHAPREVQMLACETGITVVWVIEKLVEVYKIDYASLIENTS
jgi:hypothetical protein